jgi:hypothetical protein
MEEDESLSASSSAKMLFAQRSNVSVAAAKMVLLKNLLFTFL